MTAFVVDEENLVQNGGFEQTVAAGGGASQPVVGWQTYEPSSVAPPTLIRLARQTAPTVIQSGDSFRFSADGNGLVATDLLGGTRDRGIRQEIDIADVGNGFFKIEFDWRGTASLTQPVEIYFAGEKIGVITSSSAIWSTQRYIVPVAGDTSDLTIYDPNGAKIEIDNVSILVTSSTDPADRYKGVVSDASTVSEGSDQFTGGEFDDTIDGLGGADRIDAGRGEDSITGGTGNDTIYGGVGRDTINAGAGDDLILGGRDLDRIDGGAGRDILSYEYADAAIEFYFWDTASNTGEAARDLFVGIEGVRGTVFNDTIIGDSTADVIEGAAGNDSLRGGDGNNTMYGGDGDDTLGGGQDVDSLVGGDGNDTYAIVNMRATVVEQAGDVAGAADLAIIRIYDSERSDFLASTDFTIGAGRITSTLTGEVLLLDNVEQARFQGDGKTVDLIPNLTTIVMAPDALAFTATDPAYRYHVTGNSQANTIGGSARNDTLLGEGGHDVLSGGDGADRLDGGAGNDTLIAGAGDSVDGGTDTDVLVLGFVASDTTATVASGVDTLTDGTSTLSVTGVEFVRFGTDAPVAIDTLVGPRTVTHVMAAVEVEYAAADPAKLYNVTGNDLDNAITGAALADTLLGGAGDDTLDGGGGDDSLEGGGGADFVSYADASGGVTVDLAAGTATGAAGTDSLLDLENALGSDHDDRITGQAGANLIFGGGGDDTMSGAGGEDALFGDEGRDSISGGADADVLEGGDGADTLDGEAGDDIIDGGTGNDSITGGAGSDLFTFTFAAAEAASFGSDTISDFAIGEDFIQLTLPVTIATEADFATYINIATVGADALVTLKTVAGANGLAPHGESILVRNVVAADLTFMSFLFDTPV